jgi:hypothetical protein
MDYLKISKFTENDFNSIIEGIGGRRFSEDDSKEKLKNCDYVLNDALIELKLVEENIIEKETKRDKLAKLFGKNAKTVIIAPELLTEEGKRQYYRILETPIKTALKTASKQLKKSSRFGTSVTIAIIINNGLLLMMPDEFESVATKCASNDTSGIDILLIGGNYFFSDKFDAYTIFPLKEVYLNGVYRSDLVDSIRKGWNGFLYDFMTNQICKFDLDRNKEPLQDISFTIGDILYVKPPPKMGEASSFWPHGKRPREDSTSLITCPPVATLIPRFNNKSYEIAKKSINDSWQLKGSLNEYLVWLSREIDECSLLLRPLVGIDIPCEKLSVSSFQELCDISTDIFEQQISNIIDQAREFTEKHQSLNYILLNCIEIGIDKANDVTYIEHIKEFPGLESKKSIIGGERIKFEYAVALASAYCIKVGADCVYYLRDETYKWV